MPDEDSAPRPKKKKKNKPKPTRNYRLIAAVAAPLGLLVVIGMILLLTRGPADENDRPGVAGVLPKGMIFGPGAVVQVQVDCETRERNSSARDTLKDLLRREGYKLGTGGWSIRVTARMLERSSGLTAPDESPISEWHVRGSLSLNAPDGRQLYTEEVNRPFSLKRSRFKSPDVKRDLRGPVGPLARNIYSFDYGGRSPRAAMEEEAWNMFLNNLKNAKWPRTLERATGTPGAAPAGAPTGPAPPPPNPYREGTQIKLRELRTLKAPSDAVQLAYSPKHELLFVRTKTDSIHILDLKAASPPVQLAKDKVTDMSLAPDEAALFVADFGGIPMGFGAPQKPSFVHRFDVTTRKWEIREAPSIAYRIQAVAAGRFYLLGAGASEKVSLNHWDPEVAQITEQARTGPEIQLFAGDIAYQPQSGLLYHGNSGTTRDEIAIFRIDGSQVKVLGKRETGSIYPETSGGTWEQRFAPKPTIFSVDGRHFYYGRLQFDAANENGELGLLSEKNAVRLFPENILAAGRDVAFGASAYYQTQTGKQIGSLGYPSTAYALSRSGMVLWVYEAKKSELHQYALEGEQ